jgi:hypothetical protein
VNLVGWDTLVKIVIDYLWKVKKFRLSHLSDYRSKSVGLEIKPQLMTSPSSLLQGSKGAGNDFNLDQALSLPLKSLSPHQPPEWNDPNRMLEF